ncbi:response regulator receiver protein [Caballeronia fortuita]|uniref:Response regulator receiver protein n=1 Tax=Caballeronia fortuita TaxID=1777138 RepID=A0A157ZBB0_9BURK|nr:response regulator [Caballeronia fortuita]SAK42835.1 response regulator receiver protein [Caballeronia fortuita]
MCVANKCQRWTSRDVFIGRRKPRILVVDDYIDAATAVAAYLQIEGATVKTANGCFEALRVVANWVPDVILLDIMMPEHDGFFTARALRRLSKDGFAIIAYTANDQDFVRSNGDAALFDGYCQKAISPTYLLGLMERLYSREAT